MGVLGPSAIDERWMRAALALSSRGRATSVPNPNVGCILVHHGRIVGRGWTQAGGRPHAEAMALAEAGPAAQGATAYVTLEPCAHQSARGPSCAETLITAGIQRCCVALQDPDPRTSGKGVAQLQSAGIDVQPGILEFEARQAMAGWLKQHFQNRPYVTLKLATSLDGCIALATGESKWITGEAARAHTHLERARSNAILVGRGTWDADQPRLDVRLCGLQQRAPEKIVLSSTALISAPDQISTLNACHYLMVEGGAQTAASFLKAGLVDRIMLYRAPILIGGGKPCLGDIGLDALANAHGHWSLADKRMLGSDTLEVYEAV